MSPARPNIRDPTVYGPSFIFTFMFDLSNDYEVFQDDPTRKDFTLNFCIFGMFDWYIGNRTNSTKPGFSLVRGQQNLPWDFEFW